jgi:hypothetical protein
MAAGLSKTEFPWLGFSADELCSFLNVLACAVSAGLESSCAACKHSWGRGGRCGQVFSDGLCNEKALWSSCFVMVGDPEERGMGACQGRSVGAPQRAGFVQSSLKFQVTVTAEEQTACRSRNVVMIGAAT